MAIRRVIKRSKPVDDEPEEDVEDVDLDSEELDDDADDDAVDEDDEPSPRAARKMGKKHAKPAKAAKTEKTEKKVAESEDEDEEPVKAKTVKVKAVSETLISDLVEALAEGKALVITHLSSGKWQAVAGEYVTKVSAADGGHWLRGKEYTDKVRSEEYEAWRAEWKQLTLDEKRAKAKKVGAEWESAEDDGIEAMRLSAAYRKAKGIEKYKPEYRDRSARAALRGR